MPIRAIDHIDLAVADVERSLQFYLQVLGPLGVEELYRYPSYRGTEEIVYLRIGDTGQAIGLRRADGGEYRYYDVGLEHLALSARRSTRPTGAAWRPARGSTSRPKRTATSRATSSCSSSIPTAFGSRSCTSRRNDRRTVGILVTLR
jgi:catechol 2,3-dioxygenase-like lactoylglutathione lyase family enzyme